MRERVLAGQKLGAGSGACGSAACLNTGRGDARGDTARGDDDSVPRALPGLRARSVFSYGSFRPFVEKAKLLKPRPDIGP